MKRIDCLTYLSGAVTNELVVIGMTGANWEWHQLSDRPANMKIGSMGNATAVGFGMAMSMPHRKVIVFDSDGSVLLDLATVATLGTYRPPNLVVFVFDNEVYSGSRISEPTATAFNADLELIASGAGVPAAKTVRDLHGFRAAAAAALHEESLAYIVAKVDEDVSSRVLPKPTMDYLESKYRFMRYIESEEHRSILPTLR